MQFYVKTSTHCRCQAGLLQLAGMMFLTQCEICERRDIFLFLFLAMLVLIWNINFVQWKPYNRFLIHNSKNIILRQNFIYKQIQSRTQIQIQPIRNNRTEEVLIWLDATTVCCPIKLCASCQFNVEHDQQTWDNTTRYKLARWRPIKFASEFILVLKQYQITYLNKTDTQHQEVTTDLEHNSLVSYLGQDAWKQNCITWYVKRDSTARSLTSCEPDTYNSANLGRYHNNSANLGRYHTSYGLPRIHQK